MSSVPAEEDAKISITSLLKRLWHESPSTKPTADEIAGALSLIFTNSLSEVQTGALLTCLHFTDQDRQAEVLAKCSKAMRDFSTKIEVQELEKLLQERGRKEGNYHGGFVSFLFLQRDWFSTIHSEGLKYRSLALTFYSVI
jgi:anthranilate phosphoribosyltransferase